MRLLKLVCVICVASTTFAADASPEQAKFFENEVRPLLAEKCYSCHGGDEQKGDLRLDSLATLLSGGESGAAIVPGKPEESLLIEAINYESLEMPPDEKLPDNQIAILTRWVAMGAPWPGANPNTPVRERELFDDEDRSWWAIQPVKPPSIPDPAPPFAQWPRNEIDCFIAESLTSQGLTPAPEADKLSLVRRLYLDVVGLPPTPEEVASFLNDTSLNAYESLVDRLLDSKGYGERAARAWLDLVRYADSDGYRADAYRPDAFRYRDYVIQSFNEDKPYDRFVQEQIAGDEMFPDSLEAQVALGYLRHWVYEWNIRDARTQWTTIIDDVTDTTADVFLGLGLQCAKCHNHKFDPLLQKDYLRLQAYFAPLMPREIDVAESDELADYQTKLQVWKDKTADIQAKIDAIEQPYRDKYRDIAIDRFPDDLKQIARKPPPERSPHEEQLAYLVQLQVQYEHDRLDSHISAKDKEKLIELRRELKEFDSIKPKRLPQAMVVTDVSAVAPETVMPKRKSEIIEPGVPSILDANPMPIDASPSSKTTGRRTALAKWITDPANPLSTRVMANRVWQSHFGRGLAENPSDFGRLGGQPSHPELLDWLSVELVNNGWSLKTLHRKVLLSATYRQSTEHPQFANFQQIDPANTYYWRRDTMRLSAEQIRDSLLSVTGELKDCVGGPGKLADSDCRTIYTRVMRNSPDELLDSFDLPQFFSSNSTRNTTTTPVQSLLMINSDRMLGYARRMAARVQSNSSDLKDQVQFAWQCVYGRTPTPDEIAGSLRFVDQLRAEVAADDVQTKDGLIETAKLPYRDGQSIKFDVNESALQLSVPAHQSFAVADFTIETFFQLRSIAKTGAVRTLVSNWNGSYQTSGWRLGVTGAGSRRKPQTLVLQMVGKKANAQLAEAAIFSDQHIQINTPYYASASFRLPRDGAPGTVTFYLKDLSNDDEPLQVAEIPHDLIGGFDNDLPLTLGSQSGKDVQTFDGLIDDVRFVAKALTVDEILQTVERELPGTIGYWQFETVPGVMRNSAQDQLNIVGRGSAIVNLSPDESALADFCHVLLNSNEFLYVH